MTSPALPFWANAIASTAGDTMIVICIGLIMYGGFTWMREHKDKEQSNAIVSSLLVVLGAAGIRIAAEEGFIHNASLGVDGIFHLVCGITAIFFTRRLFTSIRSYTDVQVWAFWLAVCAVSVGWASL